MLFIEARITMFCLIIFQSFFSFSSATVAATIVIAGTSQNSRVSSPTTTPRFQNENCCHCQNQGTVFKSYICEHKFCETCKEGKQQCMSCQAKETPECSICCHKIHTLRTILVCGHMYHDGCLSQWTVRSTTCPNCRAKIEYKKILKCEICNGEFKDTDEITRTKCSFYASALDFTRTEVTHSFHDACLNKKIKLTATKDSQGVISYPCPVHANCKYVLSERAQYLIDGVESEPQQNIVYSRTAKMLNLLDKHSCLICKKVFLENDEVTPLHCNDYPTVLSWTKIDVTHYFHDKCYNKYVAENINSKNTFVCPEHPFCHFRLKSDY